VCEGAGLLLVAPAHGLPRNTKQGRDTNNAVHGCDGKCGANVYGNFSNPLLENPAFS
jgi:hypothetical protein